jgi:cytidylate kinase
MPSIDDIINRQFHQWEMEKREREQVSPAPAPPARIVTVSREHGSRGAYFAMILAEKLGFQLIHKEIVDAICTSSGYRKRIVSSLDERYRSRLEMMVDSIFSGQMMDHSDYMRNLAQVVLSMARLGGVVLVGRGGNFILGPEKGFHIRFISPVENRIVNLVKYRGITEKEAADDIKRSDDERRELMRKIFDADIDDPHYYDMIVNTSFVDIENWIDPALAAIKIKFERLSRNE